MLKAKPHSIVEFSVAQVQRKNGKVKVDSDSDDCDSHTFSRAHDIVLLIFTFRPARDNDIQALLVGRTRSAFAFVFKYK